MRFHSSLPIFALDPSHRARPNCALSLATASASSRLAKSHDDAELMDVDLDPLVTFSEELPTWKVLDGVPFPCHSGKSPRKHALLRASTPLGTSNFTNGRDPAESASPNAEHEPPPRKRTRTSALLQPLVKSHRPPRVQSSLPTRPSRLPRSASSLLFLPRTIQPVPPKAAEDPFTYAFPTTTTTTTPSMPAVPNMPQSALLDLISCLIVPASLDYPSLKSSIPIPRRRKSFFSGSGGTPFLRSIYKTVVYGLALKYSVTDSSLHSTQAVYQGNNNNTARSPFDIQDALLADRLRCHLTLHGEDINIIVFQIEKMDSHPDEESPAQQASSSSSHEAESTAPVPIMSYGRLVSLILLQKSLEARSRPPSSRKTLTCRKPSSLSECYTAD